MNNKNLAIWIIFILLALLINGCVLWFMKNGETEFDTIGEQMEEVRFEYHAQVVNVDTSNWKTYRNKEYGFKIRYPGDWNIYDQIKPGLTEFSDGITYAENSSGVTVMSIQVLSEGGYGLEGFDMLEEKKVLVNGYEATFRKYKASEALKNKASNEDRDFYEKHILISVDLSDVNDVRVSFGGNQAKERYFDAFINTLEFQE